jgi:hypothetical protein
LRARCALWFDGTDPNAPGHRMKTREGKGRVSEEREEEQRQQKEMTTAIVRVCQLRMIGW